MVYPGRRSLTNLNSTVSELGIPSWARILWLEFPTHKEDKDAKAADPDKAGRRFQEVKSTFFALAESSKTKISKGEMRNFFWNLNLNEGEFANLWQSLDTRHR